MNLSKNLKSFLITILISSNICFADDAKYISAGQNAPYDGFLFTVPKTQELRKTVIEHKTYKLINESLEKSVTEQSNIITLERDKNKMLLEQNDKLAVELKDARDTSDRTKLLWFALGVIGTGLVTYGISKAVNK